MFSPRRTNSPHLSPSLKPDQDAVWRSTEDPAPFLSLRPGCLQLQSMLIDWGLLIPLQTVGCLWVSLVICTICCERQWENVMPSVGKKLSFRGSSPGTPDTQMMIEATQVGILTKKVGTVKNRISGYSYIFKLPSFERKWSHIPMFTVNLSRS